MPFFHGPLHLVCVPLLQSGSTAEDKTKIEVNRYDLGRTDRHRECTQQGEQKKNNNTNNNSEERDGDSQQERLTGKKRERDRAKLKM